MELIYPNTDVACRQDQIAAVQQTEGLVSRTSTVLVLASGYLEPDCNR